jgi:hypothetical protein
MSAFERPLCKKKHLGGLHGVRVRFAHCLALPCPIAARIALENLVADYEFSARFKVGALRACPNELSSAVIEVVAGEKTPLRTDSPVVLRLKWRRA